jgi:alkyldihydroxyacetonephosphate synthase
MTSDLPTGTAPATARPFGRWADAPIPPLEQHVRDWLSDRFGPLEPAPAVDPAELGVAPSRLDAAAREALAGALGAAHVRTDRVARLRHSAGSSYDDLLRMRSGEALDPPDAVVRPQDEAEVLAVLRVAEEHRLAVVPVGGGTSVVGGVEPGRGPGNAAVVVLDLARLSGIVRVDPIDRTATLLPGTTGPQADALLAEHGLSLGHVPQSWARASIGGYAATRSAGQASTGFGRFDSMVVGLRLATPRGVLALGTGTPNAAGPDLRQLALGSEGALGVITEVTVRVRRAPAATRYEGWMLPDLGAGLAVLRSLEQDGPRADSIPDVSRLADPEETEVQLALAGGGARTAALETYLRLRHRSGGCLAIVGWEGRTSAVRARRREAARRLRMAGAVSLGPAVGQAWRRHRFDAPSQRDALMGAGVLVETLETATTWSQLPALRDAVRGSLADSLGAPGAPAVVMAHVSHVYPTGASLYVTVLARRAEGDVAAAREQWRAAKSAATEAILAAGGTLTHHHAVGRDHAPWLGREVGDLGVEVLRTAKATLDPAGILNPGALLG